MIKIENLHKYFENKKVLNGVNLQIEEGTSSVIIDPIFITEPSPIVLPGPIITFDPIQLSDSTVIDLHIKLKFSFLKS